jgi:hypothetical protein
VPVAAIELDDDTVRGNEDVDLPAPATRSQLGAGRLSVWEQGLEFEAERELPAGHARKAAAGAA